MKATIHALTLLSTIALAGVAHAECSRPPEPTVPDGASASQEEMVQGQQDVKSFVEETNAFLDCLEAEEKEATAAAEEAEEPLTAEQRNTYVDRYNAAVDVMQKVAESFNAELRVFLDRQEQE